MNKLFFAALFCSLALTNSVHTMEQKSLDTTETNNGLPTTTYGQYISDYEHKPLDAAEREKQVANQGRRNIPIDITKQSADLPLKKLVILAVPTAAQSKQGSFVDNGRSKIYIDPLD